MKKYLIFALLASFAIHSTFAAKSGDFQLSLGWSGDSIDLGYDGDEGLANATYNGAVISLKNYNLWDIGKTFVSVGLMDSYEFTLGQQFALDIFIGPAVGFNVLDIVKFHVSPGIAFGALFAGMEAGDGDTDCFSGADGIFGFVGFGLDIQAKFFPKKRISPLVGYTLRVDSLFNQNTSDDDKLQIKNLGNKVYIGFSVNFKNKKRATAPSNDNSSAPSQNAPSQNAGDNGSNSPDNSSHTDSNIHRPGSIVRSNNNLYRN